MSKDKLRIGFLASHRGSNMQAVIDACTAGTVPALPVVVISNNQKSGALERAAQAGIANYHLSETSCGGSKSLDLKITETLQKHEVDLVVLAGYMKKIGPEVLEKFKGRIINIHPALLPKFGGPGMYGNNVHEAVLQAKEKESGATIHLVSEEYDRGKILAQTVVKVEPDDSVESLAARVLAVEHKLLVATVMKIAKHELNLPLA